MVKLNLNCIGLIFLAPKVYKLVQLILLLDVPGRLCQGLLLVSDLIRQSSSAVYDMLTISRAYEVIGLPYEHLDAALIICTGNFVSYEVLCLLNLS